MAKRPTLKNLNSGYMSAETINENFITLRNGFDNTLSRDGSTPNQMNADIDLNGFSLLNVDSISVNDIKVNGEELGLQEAVEIVNEKAEEVIDAMAIVPFWTGPFETPKAYAKNALVEYQGSTYIAKANFTASGSFDYSKWDLFAAQGGAGTGFGDMRKSENLLGLSNPPEARGNLGLGNLSTEDLVTSTFIGPQAVTSGHYANNSITFNKLATGAVDSSSLSTSNTKVPTSGTVKTYVDAFPLTKGYESSVQTFSLGTMKTFTHGLGKTPTYIAFFLICNTANSGFAVGDQVGPFTVEGAAYGANRGVVLVANDTQVKVTVGSRGLEVPTLAGGRIVIENTVSNWRMKLVAYA